MKVTKLIYRKQLLSQIIGEEGDLNDLLKCHSIRSVIILLQQAWKELSQELLKNSWLKLLNWDSGNYDSDDDLPLAQFRPTCGTYDEVLQTN